MFQQDSMARLINATRHVVLDIVVQTQSAATRDTPIYVIATNSRYNMHHRVLRHSPCRESNAGAQPHCMSEMSQKHQNHLDQEQHWARPPWRTLEHVWIRIVAWKQASKAALPEPGLTEVSPDKFGCKIRTKTGFRVLDALCRFFTLIF